MAEMDEKWENGDLICVDFDGTLTRGKARYWKDEDEELDPEMGAWVQRAYYDGSRIIIWTARPWSQANRIAAKLAEWNIPYHGIKCNKGGSSLYIDDKAVRPEEVLDETGEGKILNE